MDNEGIFAKAWLPGAMNVPVSSTKVKRITGGPPGYAVGRAAAAAGFGEVPSASPCSPGQYMLVALDGSWSCGKECPQGWLVLPDGSGGYACTEVPGRPASAPTFVRQACETAGGSWDMAKNTCIPGAPPALPPTPSTPPAPAASPSPTTAPAPSSSEGAPTWVWFAVAAGAALVGTYALTRKAR